MLDTIHNSVSELSPDTYIYHFWSSRYEAIPLKKLFPKIKKTVTKATAAEYLNHLVEDSKIYRSIHEKNYEWNKNEIEASESLGALQLFKLAQPTPATLSLVRAYRSKKIKYSKLKEALSSIEKFHFIFTAVTSSRSSGGISAMYSSFAIKLHESETPQEASILIKELVEKLRTRLPSFDEFKVAFKEIIYTNTNSKQKNLVRYILRKISNHHSYKYSVDFDELTIEHLQPQSTINNLEWKESIVGSLGNLIFLDQKTNGKLDSKDFKEKKEYLKKEKQTIPEFIVNCEEWTPEKITQHTESMAELAYKKIWSI